MNMISFALCITFWLASGVWNVSYALVIEMREFQVAEVPPGTEICALDTPSYSLSLKSALECALECQRFSYCENFNYNNFSKTCDIFFNRPKCYGPSPSCIHYQVIVIIIMLNTYFFDKYLRPLLTTKTHHKLIKKLAKERKNE